MSDDMRIILMSSKILMKRRSITRNTTGIDRFAMETRHITLLTAMTTYFFGACPV